jgi:hypothetical protein
VAGSRSWLAKVTRLPDATQRAAHALRYLKKYAPGYLTAHVELYDAKREVAQAQAKIRAAQEALRTAQNKLKAAQSRWDNLDA